MIMLDTHRHGIALYDANPHLCGGAKSDSSAEVVIAWLKDLESTAKRWLGSFVGQGCL
jgi:hypothetical protein